MDNLIHAVTPAMLDAAKPSIEQVRLQLVKDALTDDWQTTPEIARALGVEWVPGSHGDLDAVRDDLYRLYITGRAEVEETARPLRWRSKQA